MVLLWYVFFVAFGVFVLISFLIVSYSSSLLFCIVLIACCMFCFCFVWCVSCLVSFESNRKMFSFSIFNFEFWQAEFRHILETFLKKEKLDKISSKGDFSTIFLTFLKERRLDLDTIKKYDDDDDVIFPRNCEINDQIVKELIQKEYETVLVESLENIYEEIEKLGTTTASATRSSSDDEDIGDAEAEAGQEEEKQQQERKQQQQQGTGAGAEDKKKDQKKENKFVNGFVTYFSEFIYQNSIRPSIESFLTLYILELSIFEEIENQIIHYHSNQHKSISANLYTPDTLTSEAAAAAGVGGPDGLGGDQVEPLSTIADLIVFIQKCVDLRLIDACVCDEFGQSLFHMCALFDMTSILEILMKLDNDLNKYVDYLGRTPSDSAIEGGHWDIVRILSLAKMSSKVKGMAKTREKEIDLKKGIARHMVNELGDVMEQILISTIKLIHKQLPISDDLILACWMYESDFSRKELNENRIWVAIKKQVTEVFKNPSNKRAWFWFSLYLSESTV